MEHTQVEVANIERAILEAVTDIRELQELQLTLVGGGMGDTIL